MQLNFYFVFDLRKRNTLYGFNNMNRIYSQYGINGINKNNQDSFTMVEMKNRINANKELNKEFMKERYEEMCREDDIKESKEIMRERDKVLNKEISNRVMHTVYESDIEKEDKSLIRDMEFWDIGDTERLESRNGYHLNEEADEDMEFTFDYNFDNKFDDKDPFN